VQFLAETLADSPPFKRIADQLTAPGAPEPGTKSLIATVNLEQDRTELIPI